MIAFEIMVGLGTDLLLKIEKEASNIMIYCMKWVESWEGIQNCEISFLFSSIAVKFLLFSFNLSLFPHVISDA